LRFRWLTGSEPGPPRPPKWPCPSPRHIGAFAPNIGILLVGRVIQGAGGGIIPLAFGIIRDEFPRERVARAVSILAALMGAFAGAGIALAGPLSDALGYRGLFWLPAIVVAVAAIACRSSSRRRRPATPAASA
jgi:MFS family permease